MFDTIPIDLISFLAFRPLGFLSPPIHMFPAKHSAFSMTPPGAAPVAVSVRAPGRVWVKACNSFFDGAATVTTCRHEIMPPHVVDSGAPLGTGPDSAGVDFGLVDFRRPPAAFIRQDHYDHFYPQWASPLDYFRPDVRSTLASKTGHVFGTRMRTAEPIGGTFMQDVAGTAQGNWFFPGSYHSNSSDLSRSIGLASDYVDPAQPVMAVGSSVTGVGMGLYSFAVEGQGLINRAFRDVSANGNTYCYDRFLQGQSTGGMPLGRMNGVLLLTMPSETTLKAQLVAGSSCAAAARVFTAAATNFER